MNEAIRRKERTLLDSATIDHSLHRSTHRWYFLTYAVAIFGIKSRNDLRDHVPGNSYLNQVYDSELLREAIFLFVTAGAIFIMALLLLMVSCCRISPRMRHVLATFIMMLLFVIGVVLLLRNRHNADLNDFSEISPPVGVSFRGKLYIT